MKTKYEHLKLSNQLCFPLYAVSRKIINSYTRYLKPLGLTYTQYLVLLALFEEEELTVGQLCRCLYLDSGTLTPLLKKMEQQKWIDRFRSKEDERVVVVRLKPEGRALQEQVKDIPVRIGGKISLTGEETENLYRILYSILDG